MREKRVWKERRGGRGGGGFTLQAGDEAIMEGVQLKLAGAHSLAERLLAACTSGQPHISPYLHKPFIKPLLHFIHACIACLKLILQVHVRIGVCVCGPSCSGVICPIVSVYLSVYLSR